MFGFYHLTDKIFFFLRRQKLKKVSDLLPVTTFWVFPSLIHVIYFVFKCLLHLLICLQRHHLKTRVRVIVALTYVKI